MSWAIITLPELLPAAAVVSTKPPTRTLMGVGAWLRPETLLVPAGLLGLVAWRQRCGPACPICTGRQGR